MPRAVALWRGKNPDTKVPNRVRDRVFELAAHRCHACTRTIRTGETWTLEHLTALINGGQNAEDNLGVTCSNCLPGKNAADVAEKAAVYRKRAKHHGIAKSKYRPMAGTKASGVRRRMDGTVERREK